MGSVLNGRVRRGAIGGALAAILATLPGAAPPPVSERWAGAWGYAPANPGDRDEQVPPGTYRYRATLTQAGSALMLTFSNAEGLEGATIASAGVGLASGDAGVEIQPGTLRPIRFSGAAGAELPVGRSVQSDAIAMPARVGRDVVVSVTFSTPTRPAGNNPGPAVGFAPNLDRDDGSAAARFGKMRARSYLTLISVRDPVAPCTVVAFGDSITDGYLAQSSTRRGWPARLSERLAALPAARRCGVMNMGVSGNRVLRDGRGVAGLDRFWRDVASVPGVTHIILLEGINDIGNSGSGDNPVVTPQSLTNGYRQFVTRAHALGIQVIGATMTPARHAKYMSADKEVTRKAANDFIRTGGLFDGVVDFEAAVRDTPAAEKMRTEFDPGDHLHPNDAGLRAMGDAVDLKLLTPARR